MVMGQPGQAQPRVLGFRNDFPEERESKMKGKCVLSLGNNNQLDDGSWTGPDSELIESEEIFDLWQFCQGKFIWGPRRYMVVPNERKDHFLRVTRELMTTPPEAEEDEDGEGEDKD